MTALRRTHIRREPARLVADAILAQRAVPVTDAVLLQALAAAGLAVSVSNGAPGWHGGLVGLAIALTLVVRVHGMSISGWVTCRLGFWCNRRRRNADRTSSRPESFDADLADGGRIGFHWYGETLVSVIQVGVDVRAMTVVEPATTVSEHTIPIALLAGCLRQYDVDLESIDVISHGARLPAALHPASGRIVAAYDAVLGPLPAIADRSAYVIVRFDASRCPEAVRERGDGWAGVVRTATTATRRIANRLSDAGLVTQLMTAGEIFAATTGLLDGAGLDDIDETWAACHRGRFELRSFVLEPSAFSSAGLDRLWTVPSHSTTVSVSLCADPHDRRVRLRGLVRFNGPRDSGVPLPGLGRLAGRQHAALAATLPVPAPLRAVPASVCARGEDALAGLALPVAGCGQIVGADDRGRAVALTLFGPGIRRVELCGTLRLAQQVTLRSLALGARVRVRTSRPEKWRAMAEKLGDAELFVIHDAASSRLPKVQHAYSVEVFDETLEVPVEAGVTAMVVKPEHAVPTLAADAALVVLDSDDDIVRVVTGLGSVVVRMVATETEMRLMASFAAA